MEFPIAENYEMAILSTSMSQFSLMGTMEIHREHCVLVQMSRRRLESLLRIQKRRSSNQLTFVSREFQYDKLEVPFSNLQTSGDTELSETLLDMVWAGYSIAARPYCMDGIWSEE